MLSDNRERWEGTRLKAQNKGPFKSGFHRSGSWGKDEALSVKSPRGRLWRASRGKGTLGGPRRTDTCSVLLSDKDDHSQTFQELKDKSVMKDSHHLALGKNCCKIPRLSSQTP